jgi:hypothetical protein
MTTAPDDDRRSKGVKMAFKHMMVAAALAVAVVTGVWIGRARAQVLTPRPEELRFVAVLTEPVAMPDRRSVLAGTSVLLVRDRRSGQCYLAVSVGDSVGLAPARCEE